MSIYIYTLYLYIIYIYIYILFTCIYGRIHTYVTAIDIRYMLTRSTGKMYGSGLENNL